MLRAQERIAERTPLGQEVHGGDSERDGDARPPFRAMYFDIVAAVIDAAPDLVTAMRDCFSGAAAVLQATDYADACPIATVALEVANTNEPLRQATAEVFESWIVGAMERFRPAGLDDRTARELSLLFIMLIEGAFVLCRAARNRSARGRRRRRGRGRRGRVARPLSRFTPPPGRARRRALPIRRAAMWRAVFPRRVRDPYR